MRLTFTEKTTLGLGWSIAVRHGNFLIGHIRKIPYGDIYRNFHGPHNEMNHDFEDLNIEALKARISEKYGRFRYKFSLAPAQRVPAQAAQHTLKRVKRAFQAFFRRICA